MTAGEAREYARAGVDLSSADRAKARIAELVERTRTTHSLGAVGAFGGMVRVPPGFSAPILVLSTDGVGTKVVVAHRARRFDTIGEDLVNHSVNDVLVHGAMPLAFMDYIAGAELEVGVIGQIVEGIARACRIHGMALAGGETAQMPGLYQPGTFDLAGTIVGVVEEGRAIHGTAIAPGDTLLGYASSGLHTNGYTLARRVIFERMGLDVDDLLEGTGQTVGEALLEVHRSYYRSAGPVLDRFHGLAHITGGGIAGNLVRILPQDCMATVDPAAWELPALFRFLQQAGQISTQEMREVFNLGVGLVAVLPPDAVAAARAAAAEAGVTTWVMGEIQRGTRAVRFARP